MQVGWLFQEDLIDERSSALGPGIDLIRNGQTINRDGEEKDDQYDYDPTWQSLFHLFLPFLCSQLREFLKLKNSIYCAKPENKERPGTFF